MSSQGGLCLPIDPWLKLVIAALAGIALFAYIVK